MKRFPIAASLAALAFAGSATARPAGEEALLPVGDLLEAAARTSVCARVGGRDVVGGTLWRGIAGAGTLAPSADQFGNEEPRSWLDEGDLVTIVGALSPNGISDLAAEGGALRVPAARAAATEAILAGIRAALPPLVDLDVALEEVPAEGAARVLAGGHGAVRSGTVALFGDSLDRSAVVDYDVEIAESASIADPVVATVSSGCTLAVRVRPLPARPAAVVEVFVRTAQDEKSEPIDTGHPGMGRIDRAKMRVDELATAFLLEAGRPAEFVLSSRGGRTLRLRATARWSHAAPPAADAALAYSGTTLLSDPVLAFANREATAPPGEEQERADPVGREFPLDEGIAAALDRRAATALVARDSGVVVFQGAQAAQAAAAFDAWCASRVTGCHVEVTVASVPVGVAVAADRPLPEDAQVLVRASGPMVVGLASVFNGATEQGYLRDWDVEVAQASRIADPIPWRLGDGAYMDLCVIGGAGGRPGAVRLGIDLSRLEGMDREAFPVGQGLPARVRAGASSSDNANSAATDPRLTLMSGLPPETVAVERPALRRFRFDATAALGTDGNAILRRSSPAFAGAGREIVVLVRAK